MDTDTATSVAQQEVIPLDELSSADVTLGEISSAH